MTVKTAAKAAVGTLLVLAAPLALAQSVVPTGNSSTNSSGAYVSPSTQTSGSAATNTTSGSATTNSTTGSSSTTGTSGSSTTPGVPNTGAGGDMATNLAVLVLSGAMALGGIAYLARTRAVWRA